MFSVGVATSTHYCMGNGDTIQVSGVAYVAIDPFFDDPYLFSIRTYLEANGEPGLQRGGASLFGDEDACQDSPNPDLYVI